MILTSFLWVGGRGRVITLMSEGHWSYLKEASGKNTRLPESAMEHRKRRCGFSVSVEQACRKRKESLCAHVCDVWYFRVISDFSVTFTVCFTVGLVVADCKSFYAKWIDPSAITMHLSVSFFNWSIDWSSWTNVGPESSSVPGQDHGVLQKSMVFIESLNIRQNQPHMHNAAYLPNIFTQENAVLMTLRPEHCWKNPCTQINPGGVKPLYSCIPWCSMVVFPPGISEFVLHPVPMEVTEGSVARFSCAVTSSPPATITWELNQSTLPLHTDRYLLLVVTNSIEPSSQYIPGVSSVPHLKPPRSLMLFTVSSLLFLAAPRITVLPNGVLQIHNVQAEDAGDYRCVATNIGSRLRSNEATLTVHKGAVTPWTGFEWALNIEHCENQSR